MLGVIAAPESALLGFGHGCLQRFAHFERHQVSALVFFFFQNLGRAHHFCRAVGERRPPMHLKSRHRQLQFLLDLRRGQGFKGLYDFTGRGIYRRNRHP